MTRSEAMTLKPGELVKVVHKDSRYRGLIFEIESIDKRNKFEVRVTLKQAGGYDGGFRKSNQYAQCLERVSR